MTDGGTISLGDRAALDTGVSLTAKYGHINVGPGVFIGKHSVLVARDSISIGADTLIAEHVTIRDQDHNFEVDIPIISSGYKEMPISIGRNVWIGAKSTILKGVTIGDNVVIGANSVVTRNLPSNILAFGAPARVIRNLQ